MILYLAGPMRGYDRWNFPAFDEAAARLRVAGHVVVSPADLDRGAGFDENTADSLPDGFLAAAMRRDIEALLKVEALALLPGWERSTGSRFELSVARMLGLDVFEVQHRRLPGDGDIFTHLEPLPEDVDGSAVLAGVRFDNHAVAWPGALFTHNQAVAHWLERVGEPDAEQPHAEVRVTSATGGQKGSKLARFDMIPPDVLWELAEHYGRGEAKYPSDPVTHEANWQKGYAWSLSVAALQRHLSAWLQGEDDDPETGSSHLMAVAWHAFALRWWQIHERGTDDVRLIRAVAS